MGVEGSIDDEPLNTQSANPQNRYPQTAQLAGNMPVLRRWRPRDGRTKEYHLHVDSLVDAVIAAGWHPNILDYSMPQMSQIKMAYPKANASRLDALLKDAIADHQEQNTMLFNLLKPSYEIEGEYELDDLESINAFRDGLVADGRGLLRWARYAAWLLPLVLTQVVSTCRGCQGIMMVTLRLQLKLMESWQARNA